MGRKARTDERTNMIPEVVRRSQDLPAKLKEAKEILVDLLTRLAVSLRSASAEIPAAA
jgi:hypothetical protein